MTEHCINNGTSICQTEDATHLVVRYTDFTYNNTIGGTYCGKRMELMFHFTTDLESYDDRLILCVTSMSNRTRHVILYDDPYDNNTNGTLKELLAKETLELYTLRDFEFNKRDELLIYIRIGEENIQLFDQVVEEEEMLRLYKCLKSLYEDYEFSDMTVQGKWPAHRAVVAAASKLLDEAVSNLPFNKSATEDCDATKSKDLVPVTTEKNKVDTENVKKLETASNFLLNKSAIEEDNATTRTDLVTAITDKNKADTEHVREQQTELQCLTSKSLGDVVSNLPRNKSSTEDNNAKRSTNLISAITEKNKSVTENSKDTELQCFTNKSLGEAISILPLNKNATEDSATSKTEEQKTKLQQLVSAIFAIADNIKDLPLGRLIKDFRDNLEKDVTSSADDEINFNKPVSSNYIMNFTGLTLSVAKQLLSYIYTGNLYVSSGDRDDGEILNLFITVTSYKIESVLNLLEKKCIGWIGRISLYNDAGVEQDPFVHKCILSTPRHKFKTHGTFTFIVPNISELNEYNYKHIYLCNKALRVRLRKHVEDDICYLSTFLLMVGMQRWTMMLNFDFLILKDKDIPNHRKYKSLRSIIRPGGGRGWPKSIIWENLIDPNNGYVKNDAITVKVFVEVLDSWMHERI